MKKINKMTDLPKWFSLENYNSINGLSDLNLINQLAMRMEVANDDFEWLDTYPGARNEFASFMEERFSNPIRPLSGKLFAEKIKRKKYSEWQMDAVGGVEPLRLIDVMQLSKKAAHYIDENKINRSLRGQKRSVSKTISDNDQMHITLDLSWPDEILLSDLAALLPIWRMDLERKSENSCKLSNSWSVIKKKIFDYKILPMLDLMEWAKINNATITNRVLSLALFPNAEYDAIGIAQTIKPFIRNFSADFSIEILKRKAMDSF
ncbi:DUF6387 family protein [Enterobacter cloacae complex sp.6730869]|uniref:DUF6387 family protein n=2 Tax=Enterobacter cloacae complex TaxID=354276 RepID=UPI001251CD23|nr:Uncharacterised protein [Klebsiella pneumoniae]